MEFISLSQFLWQLFNFLLFYFVVSRYVVPPIQRVMTKRRQEIEEGLEFSQRAKKELELSETKREEILSDARVESNSIIEDAKKRGDQIIQEARKEATVLAEKDVAQMKALIEEERKTRADQMDKEVVELAMAVLEKSFKHTLGNSHELVKKELSQLSKVKEYIHERTS